MSIHHCLSLKLPDVVADIKINAVLLPFTANQLEAQNIQNDRGQFIDQARKITIIFSAKIYIWWFHDIVQSYQYVCYHVEQWKSGRKCAILFQQIGNISSEKRNWNTFETFFKKLKDDIQPVMIKWKRKCVWQSAISVLAIMFSSRTVSLHLCETNWGYFVGKRELEYFAKTFCKKLKNDSQMVLIHKGRTEYLWQSTISVLTIMFSSQTVSLRLCETNWEYFVRERELEYFAENLVGNWRMTHNWRGYKGKTKYV